MSRESAAAGRPTLMTEDAPGSAKAELERRMEEARGSLAQTVTEIKDSVTGQFEAVKESVAETLDWREQVRRHPLEWGLAALAVGFAVGYRLSGTLGETEAFARLNAEVDAIGDRLVDKLSAIGDRLVDQIPEAEQYVAPALAGVALPLLASQLKSLTGFDLSSLLRSPDAGAAGDAGTKKRADKGGKKKRDGGAKKKKAKRKKG